MLTLPVFIRVLKLIIFLKIKGRGIKSCHQWSELFCGKIMMLIFSFSTLLQVCSPHKFIDHLEAVQQLVLTELTEMTYLVWWLPHLVRQPQKAFTDPQLKQVRHRSPGNQTVLQTGINQLRPRLDQINTESPLCYVSTKPFYEQIVKSYLLGTHSIFKVFTIVFLINSQDTCNFSQEIRNHKKIIKITSSIS